MKTAMIQQMDALYLFMICASCSYLLAPGVSNVGLHELSGCCKLLLWVITTEKLPLLNNRTVRQMAHTPLTRFTLNNFEFATLPYAMLGSRIGEQHIQ